MTDTELADLADKIWPEIDGLFGRGARLELVRRILAEAQSGAEPMFVIFDGPQEQSQWIKKIKIDLTEYDAPMFVLGSTLLAIRGHSTDHEVFWETSDRHIKHDELVCLQGAEEFYTTPQVHSWVPPISQEGYDAGTKLYAAPPPTAAAPVAWLEYQHGELVDAVLSVSQLRGMTYEPLYAAPQRTGMMSEVTSAMEEAGMEKAKFYFAHSVTRTSVTGIFKAMLAAAPPPTAAPILPKPDSLGVVHQPQGETTSVMPDAAAIPAHMERNLSWYLPEELANATAPLCPKCKGNRMDMPCAYPEACYYAAPQPTAAAPEGVLLKPVNLGEHGPSPVLPAAPQRTAQERASDSPTEPTDLAIKSPAAAPIQAHSKSQLKRLTTQGANVVAQEQGGQDLGSASAKDSDAGLAPAAATPETDEFVREHSYDSCAGFARKLERERNKLRAALEEEKSLHQIASEDAEASWKAAREYQAALEKENAQREAHARDIDQLRAALETERKAREEAEEQRNISWNAWKAWMQRAEAAEAALAAAEFARDQLHGMAIARAEKAEARVRELENSDANLG